MNRLIIIGNGFDMAHGLKTSYMDFINWYWEQRANSLKHNGSPVSKDCLCELKIYGFIWSCFDISEFKDENGQWEYLGNRLLPEFKKRYERISIKNSRFFETIMKSIETKGWVDIENDYYQLLKNCVDNPSSDYTIKELNEQLEFLKEKLIEYLSTIKKASVRKDLEDAMIDYFDPNDFSTEGKKKALEDIGLDISDLKDIKNNNDERKKLLPAKIMLLSFNYTETAKKYDNYNITHNYIHGELEKPEDIIFGYGDELERSYQHILDANDNDLLKNFKSIRYLETGNYRNLLEFLIDAPFQVLIMGHSCGNSDRTLLNTVFEHDNCISIKTFYHKSGVDGKDNYQELVQNISRNFTNMKLFRDRVVNKKQCKEM